MARLMWLMGRQLTSKSRFYPRKGKDGFRSDFERVTGKQLNTAGMLFTFETLTLPFIQPAADRKYTPDFILDNGIIVETKGQLDAADRKKMILIRAQYPLLDIRFVFSYARGKIYKGSKTTYAKWAADHGYKWADKTIPEAWLLEPKKDLDLTREVT